MCTEKEHPQVRARTRHAIKQVVEAIEVKFLVEVVSGGPVRLELDESST